MCTQIFSKMKVGMGQQYSRVYNKGGDSLFYTVTSRVSIKQSMNLLVGTVIDNKVVIKPPKMNILEDLMDILEAQYKGIFAIDLNHCMLFMDKKGILEFSQVMPLIVFIPMKENKIETLYEELIRLEKKNPEEFDRLTNTIYEQVDVIMADIIEENKPAYNLRSKRSPKQL